MSKRIILQNELKKLKELKELKGVEGFALGYGSIPP